MHSLKGALVAAILAVAVSVAAAEPAGAKGGTRPDAQAATTGRTAHGTTSQGKAILVTLEVPLKPRRVRLRFEFSVPCSDGATYETGANVVGRVTPYVASGGSPRLETRVRYEFEALRTWALPTPLETISAPLRIRVFGVIRILARTHLRVTGALEPTLQLPSGEACVAPITYSAHTGLP